MIDIFTFIEALWFILPAYAANGLVPLLKGKHAIDSGIKLRDGMPLFGKGKTWEGFIGGCIIGALIGMVEMVAYPYLPFNLSPVPLTIVPMSPILGFILGFGSMFGDLISSFVKRRLKIKRGSPAPLLDQLDFVIGALFFSSLLVSIKIEWVVILLVITPVLHLIANGVAYLIKVKNVPW